MYPCLGLAETCQCRAKRDSAPHAVGLLSGPPPLSTLATGSATATPRRRRRRRSRDSNESVAGRPEQLADVGRSNLALQ